MHHFDFKCQHPKHFTAEQFDLKLMNQKRFFLPE